MIPHIDLPVNRYRRSVRRTHQSACEILDFFDDFRLSLHAVERNGKILRANRAELEMLGYTPEEYVGHSIAEFHVNPSTSADILKRLAAGERLESYPAELRRKDGSSREVEISSSVSFAQGAFVHSWCLTRDVSDTKMSEKIRAEQTRLATLRADIGNTLTQSADLSEVIRQCAEHLMDYANVTVVRIWTLSTDGGSLELRGSSSRRTEIDAPYRSIPINQSTIGMVASTRLPFFSNEFVDNAQINLSAPPTNREVSFAGYPLVANDAVVGVLGLFSHHPMPKESSLSLDQISDALALAIQRRKREISLNKAKLVAEEANRAKSEFLASMSHEIRTPLTAILGYTDLLTDRTISEQEFASHIKTIRRSGDHLMMIVNDILDISKIESGKMTIERVSFSPVDLVSDILACFQEQARNKQLTLTADVVGLIPRSICSDPVRVRQILANLVSNAVKFTDRGSVKLIMRYIPGRAAKEPQLAFDVIDTGIGLTEEQIVRIFIPFVQADNSVTRRFGGTGLGLTISRHIARMLAGDVIATSVLGQGSTFTATVATGPIQEVEFVDSLPFRLSTSVPTENIIRLDGRILLVEDNMVNQRLVCTWLTKAGATVDLAANGKVAIEKVIVCNQEPSSDTSYDLVLMDMHMPVLDGCTATSQLRNQGFLLPIVALTANAMNEDRLRCFKAGYDDFLTKPIDRNQLLNVCLDLISNHRESTTLLKERRLRLSAASTQVECFS